jgi:hypothetical protein
VRVRPLGGNRAGEVRIGRFLRNARVSGEEMFATARTHTASRVAGRHILVPQDSTSLRDDGKDSGLYLHPAIALDAADGALLGLVHAEFLRREGRKEVHRHKRPLAEKESLRWLTAANKAAELLAAGATQVTMIGDSESDIYAAFALRPSGVDLLVRCHHDRMLTDKSRLFACTQAAPELGRQTITLPSAPGRPARDVVLALRTRRVWISRPEPKLAGDAAALPRSVELSFVEAYEVAPPKEGTPLHWRLLTTHAVKTFADAIKITGFYRERWTIEQLFRVMKTKGFDIEAVRIEDTDPFEKLAAATLIAAVQVQQMVRDRDGNAGRPLEDVLDPADLPALEAIGRSLEGKTARQKNPHPPGSLASAAWVCARLGGWTGYYGKPGPVVILQGFLRLKAMLHGWRIGRLV